MLTKDDNWITDEVLEYEVLLLLLSDKKYDQMTTVQIIHALRKIEEIGTVLKNTKIKRLQKTIEKIKGELQ